MIKSRNFLIALVALISLAIAGYFAVGYFKKSDAKTMDDPIRIGITLTGDSIPAIIATEKGFFRAEGLTPTVSYYPYGAISLNNLLDGNVDLAMVAETPLIVQSFKRNDFAVIANISSTYQSRKIVGLTGNGIHSLEDLRGKRIGVLRNTSAHYFLEILLQENRIPLKEIRLVFIKEDEAPLALKDGRVDAIAAFEPYPAIIQSQWPPGALWVTDGDGRVRTAFSYVLKREYLNTHQEVAKKVIKATNKAIEWMNLHEDETIAISSKVLKIDPKLMRQIYSSYAFGVGIDEVFLLGMRQQAQWYQSSDPKLTELKIPRYVDYVDPAALLETFPRTVHYAR